jgi:hypothetical protein
MKICAFSYDAMLCSAVTHLPRSVELYEHVLGVVDDDIIERFSLRDNNGSNHVLRFNLHVIMGDNDELKGVLVSKM